MLEKNRLIRTILSMLALAVFLSMGIVGCINTKTQSHDAEEVSDGNGTGAQTEEIINTAMEEAEQKLLEALKPLPQKDTGVKLAAIESTLANSFWITMQEGYEDAAKEYGISIDVMATETETDIDGQIGRASWRERV